MCARDSRRATEKARKAWGQRAVVLYRGGGVGGVFKNIFKVLLLFLSIFNMYDQKETKFCSVILMIEIEESLKRYS